MTTSQDAQPDTTNVHTPLTLANLFARAEKVRKQLAEWAATDEQRING